MFKEEMLLEQKNVRTNIVKAINVRTKMLE